MHDAGNKIKLLEVMERNVEATKLNLEEMKPNVEAHTKRSEAQKLGLVNSFHFTSKAER